ncbi:hypothetical protein BOTBODRAFT_147845 [Botryobasidium botryosum FD-172 SS1]|uniref:WW domain-containing protein n=1 Tax=Botryobasidium botryosum (strain FD-172 SS1) TaxID=930990 RepID=A0A067MEY9_BOTB1|nr:hypothetical protein BOTBODRAFT_147845 [Botryobasidium botryosum FD-172 SS1]
MPLAFRLKALGTALGKTPVSYTHGRIFPDWTDRTLEASLAAHQTSTLTQPLSHSAPYSELSDSPCGLFMQTTGNEQEPFDYSDGCLYDAAAITSPSETSRSLRACSKGGASLLLKAVFEYPFSLQEFAPSETAQWHPAASVLWGDISGFYFTIGRTSVCRCNIPEGGMNRFPGDAQHCALNRWFASWKARGPLISSLQPTIAVTAMLWRLPTFESGDVDITAAARSPVTPDLEKEPKCSVIHDLKPTKRPLTSPRSGSSDSEEFIPEDDLPDIPTPDGWELHVHPDGWVYFDSPHRKFVTDRDIRQPSILKRIEADIANWAPKFGWAAHIDVMHNLVDGDWMVYVDHSNRISEVFQAHDPPNPIALKASGWRQRKKYEMAYWRQFKNYPSHRPLPDDAEGLARAALGTSKLGKLLYGNKSLNSPFSPKESEQMSELLDSFNSEATRIHKVALVSHILEYVAQHAHDNGTLHHALSKIQIKEGIEKPSGLMMFVMGLFFGVPFSYIHHFHPLLDKSNQTDILWERWWEEYSKRIVQEWTDFNLVAAVLVSATIAFLDVQGIDDASRVGLLISVMCALGCLINGLFLIWRHRAHRRDPGWYVVSVQYRHGPYAVAILLSLPLVFLIWAILTFAFSVLCFSFRGSTDGKEPSFAPWMGSTVLVVTMAVMSPSAAVMCLFLRMLKDKRRNYEKPM